ncbi:hypothetical protein COLO4_23448 [Corchorus olitorius]|uniref:Uncharacterized protein n=1 Tax=Corchorus olitorius TaxID=93759 RepID=A0A1R3IGH9_9ROSI|nr:hypothetical protein COLO4_23448 [Corchorus olitorius]
MAVTNEAATVIPLAVPGVEKKKKRDGEQGCNNTHNDGNAWFERRRSSGSYSRTRTIFFSRGRIRCSSKGKITSGMNFRPALQAKRG